MFDELEALLALADLGTMTRAAQRLRISQSAVSKRIASLAHELGIELVQRHGRRVRLTPAATRLVERTRPLLAELRGTVAGEQADLRVSVGVSESILSSWGAAALHQARPEGVTLALAAHRSPVVIERVRAGEMMLGLCAGRLAPSPDLIAERVWREPLVLVPSGEGRLVLRRNRAIPVISIEQGSATWRSLAKALRVLRRETSITLQVTRQVQSFACIVQLARAGFGHGLVPQGVAETMGVRGYRSLPPPGVARPVALMGRPSTLARPQLTRFTASLCRHIDALLGPEGAPRKQPGRRRR